MTRGYRLAAAILAIELLVALALLSPAFGLFAILAIVAVGIAWLPAAFLILADRGSSRDSGSGTLGYLIAGLCFIAGSMCACTLVKWSLLGMAVK
jgi:hypothetical protein